MNKKKLAIDTIYNIGASIAPIVFLQLLVYPLMSRLMSIEDYGLAITLIGLAMLVIQVSGIGINNTRIIMNKKYIEKSLNGDFNIIVSIIFLINLIIIVLILKSFSISFFSIEGLLFFIYVEFGFLNVYFTSEFNSNLLFNKVLISNVFLIVGYFVGLILFLITKQWLLIFVTGIILIIVYEIKNTNYWKEGFKKTELYPETFQKVIIISFSSLMISMVTYGDRLFLYPMLGSSMVAIYYTSSQFGKLIGMGLSPISTIMLSVLSKKKEITLKLFWQLNIVNFICCGLFFFISLFIAKPVMFFLYPAMANEIGEYINIANLAAIIMASSGIIQPMILNFCSTKWQVIIQVIHIFLYFVLGFIFIEKWGLLGFCYSSAITALVRVFLLCVVGTTTLSKKKSMKGIN